jgi:hypothetical protein
MRGPSSGARLLAESGRYRGTRGEFAPRQAATDGCPLFFKPIGDLRRSIALSRTLTEFDRAMTNVRVVYHVGSGTLATTTTDMGDSHHSHVPPITRQRRTRSWSREYGPKPLRQRVDHS